MERIVYVAVTAGSSTGLKYNVVNVSFHKERKERLAFS